jgi:hypothetical protein
MKNSIQVAINTLVASLVLVTNLSSASTRSHAIERNDVPSCNVNYQNDQQVQQAPLSRELFILVDRTMVSALSTGIKQDMFSNLTRFLQPGDKVQIVSFSSFQDGAYTKVHFNGKLSSPLTQTEQQSLAQSKVRGLKRCLTKQRHFMLNALGSSLQNTFEPMQNNKNTELIVGLHQISDSLIRPSAAKRKVVLLISDMLEHSDVTSFYRNNRARVIDAESEFQKVSRSSLKGQFDGADMFVVGSGLSIQTNSGLATKALSSHETFWRTYFQQSNAQLQGYGKPMVLGGFY